MKIETVPQSFLNYIYKHTNDNLLVNSNLDVMQFLKFNYYIFIAGGFLRSYFTKERASDLDIFFQSERAFDSFLLSAEDYGYKRVFQTDRAISIQKNGFQIQLIRYKYFGSDLEIMDAFDFTIAKCGVSISPDNGGSHLFYDDNYFKHLAIKDLIYTGSELPLSSLKRAIKYVQKGFTICDENLIKIVEDIQLTVNQGNMAQHIESFDPDGKRRIYPID